MQQTLSSASQQMPDPPPGPRIQTALPDTGEVVLGRSLVSLLDEAISQNPNPKAFNERTEQGWQALSTQAFKRRAEHLALGLRERGLKRGDRVAFFTHSDLSFCLPDMACLIAGLVTVPIYLTHSPEAIKHILNETEARALIVSDEALLTEIRPVLKDTTLEHIVLYRSPETLPQSSFELTSCKALEQLGEQVLNEKPERLETLKKQIKADDLATLIYTSGTTGLPKGVMLSHENISSNAIASMTGLTSFKRGADQEVVLSFLPLTHIFARTLQYAMMWYGAAVYYSDPDSLRDHLQEVKPTFFASVPRVLEKAFERIMATGASLTGVKKNLFDWAMGLANQYDVEHPPTGMSAFQLKMADKLVFSKWRAALGGNIRQIIVGGAALRPELVNVFGAASIEILQGYGLTETSPVISYNRPGLNKAGMVGPPLAGVEVMIGNDGEILTRGPHIMKGYYKHDDKTAEVIDADGWFHTGDMGELGEDGFLKITGRIKNLFKLSTGKYVMPQPLEDMLEGQALIGNALVVGEGEKYCAAVIFVSKEALAELGKGESLEALKDPELQAHFKELAQAANARMPHWSQVKKLVLILEELTTDNGMLTPKMSVKRNVVLKHYDAYVRALFGSSDTLDNGVVTEI